MRFSKINGLIRRRILVNFRVDPALVQCLLPDPFKPKLIKGWAMAGICLIRLERVRPSWCVVPFGLSSENAAHRIAISWTDKENQLQEGVYIPRRDSSSMISHLFGEKLFSGKHHRAIFHVHDKDGRVNLRAHALDDSLSIELKGCAADKLPRKSVFSDLEEASKFFENGSLGYSPTTAKSLVDGIRLTTASWAVKPFSVETIRSSYFADESLFPKGTAEFDCALIMRSIESSWQIAPKLEVSNRIQ